MIIKILILAAYLLLLGCAGPAKFDASNEASIKESTEAIISECDEAEREEFSKALIFFSFGGE